MANNNLNASQTAKYDEYYTQYADIQKEINAYLEYNPDVFKNKTILCPCDDPEWSNFTKFFAQNFENFGLKKLISTSYAIESKMKKYEKPYQMSLFDYECNPSFDESKEKRHGKIFTLSHGVDISKLDINKLEWRYLDGDGDFRSDEVKVLRDETDIIITNPPFSLYPEFVRWIIDGDKDFLILGNKNSITYKDIFPLIKSNKMWQGCSSPDKYDSVDGLTEKIKGLTRWFTNIKHGRRYMPLQLMSMKDNLKYSSHKNNKKWDLAYHKYDNYDAIEVPFVDSIPCDYDGIMGVPPTFIDKYCPEQFEILGATESEGKGFSCGLWDAESNVAQAMINGIKLYKRLFIKHK